MPPKPGRSEPRYRLVVFDFDGTLADSFGWFSRELNAAADRHGFKRVEGHEVETLRGLGSRAILRHLGIPLRKVPRIAAEMKEAMTTGEPVRLFPGVEAMLARLREGGVTVEVVSSNSDRNVRRILGPEGAAGVGLSGCGASLFGKGRRFRRIVRRRGVPAKQVLCVGDEQRDIEAAHETGFAAGAVSWGYATFEALRALGPEEEFTSVGQIVERVLGEPARPLAAPPGKATRAHVPHAHRVPRRRRRRERPLPPRPEDRPRVVEPDAGADGRLRGGLRGLGRCGALFQRGERRAGVGRADVLGSRVADWRRRLPHRGWLPARLPLGRRPAVVGVAVNAAAAIMLIPVALTVFKEPFSLTRIAGMGLCVAGLALIAR